MGDLEGVLDELLAGVGGEHDVPDLDELVGDLLAEGVGELGEEVGIVVQQYEHDSECA